MNIDFTKPIFFNRNRVYRIYKGGLLFSNFFGDKKEDNNYPEEWVASTVHALNPGHSDPSEGLSFVENTHITLKSLIQQHALEMCGPSRRFSLLVKLLDSAIRLPLQVHPTPEFSQKYLNSNFGKTEMWMILETRPDACIYFGFREEMTKEKFITYIEQSKTNPKAMDNLLNRIPVQSGDVFLVPARSVHAIGAGCLILEVQEPTDFTIGPEYWCGDYCQKEEELYLGLDRNIALDCFNYNLCGSESLSISRKIPHILTDIDGVKKEILMSYDDTPCFSVYKYTIKNGNLTLATAPAIHIVTNGCGKIVSKNYERRIQKGDYFFLPYSAKNKCSITSDSDLEIVECLPAL